MGRRLLRAAMKLPDVEIVAICDTCPVEYLAYILKFDAWNGPYEGTVEADVENGILIVDGQSIAVVANDHYHSDQQVPAEADYAVECSHQTVTAVYDAKTGADATDRLTALLCLCKEEIGNGQGQL